MMMPDEELRCPCFEKRSLLAKNGGLACSDENCPHSREPDHFQRSHGKPVLIAFKKTDTVCTPSTGDVSEKIFSGNPPKYLDFARRLVYGASVRSTRNCSRFLHCVKQTSSSPCVLVIGSGEKGAGTDALWDDPAVRKTGIDIYVSPTVDYIADAHFLPFASASFDGVWIQAVLEHVASPADVVKEIHRVLKPGGVVYAETPFMQQVHAGPYDFTRYTVTGHRFLFRDFDLVDMGGNGGPAHVLAWSVKYLFWSLSKSRRLGIAASIPFFLAARALDPLVGESALWDASSGVYFLGIKGDAQPMRAKDLPILYRGLQA
jgi:SAM-dependent methyltransferase